MSQPPVRAAASFATRLLGIPIRFLGKVQWADEMLGFELARALWAGGPLGRSGLLVLVGGTATSAWLVSGAAARIAPSSSPVPLPSLLGGLALITLGWAFALTAGARCPLAGYTALAAYLTWYGMLIGMGMMKSLAFTLPIWWMLGLGWWMARRSPGRSRFAWLMALCLGAAWLLFTPLDLNAQFPGEWNLPARLALALALFVALATPLALSKRSTTQVRSAPVLLGSVGIIGAFYALAGRADLTALGENALLALDGLMGAISLFWLWLGAGVVDGALKAGEFASREWAGLVRKAWAAWAVPAVWALVAILGGFALYLPPRSASVIEWVNRWPDSLYFSLRGQVIVSLAAVATALVAALLRRASPRLLSWLNGIWAAAFIIQLGYYNKAFSLASYGSQDPQLADLWPALLLVGGLTWQLAKGGAEWTKASQGRRLGWVAVLLWLLGAITILVSAGTPLVREAIALYSFQGIVYLGLPVLIYNIIRPWKSLAMIEGRKLAVLFGLGWLSALPALGLGAEIGPQLAVAPLTWAVILAIFGRILARLTRPADGVIAGGALALGFVTGWLSPQLIPIPFLRAAFDLQMGFLGPAWARPHLEALQWPLTAVACLSGLSVGIPHALAGRWRWGLRLGGTLVGALIMGVLAPRLVGTRALSEATPSPTHRPPPVPSIQIPTPPPNWVETPLNLEGLTVLLPPGLRVNPNENSALLLDLLSPSGEAAFSFRLFPVPADLQAVVSEDARAWEAVLADYDETRQAERILLGSHEVWWREWESASMGARAADAFLEIPQGVLRSTLLSTVSEFEARRTELQQIVASLRID